MEIFSFTYIFVKSKLTWVLNLLSCSNSILTCNWTFSWLLTLEFWLSELLEFVFKLSSRDFTASSRLNSDSLFLYLVQKSITCVESLANLIRKSFFSASNWAALEVEDTNVSASSVPPESSPPENDKKIFCIFHFFQYS